MKVTPSERQIESSILSYLAMQDDCFAFKFKDQAKFIEGRYRKAKWEINGVSDICCLMPGGKVLWIEVKTEKGKQSDYQKNFQDKIELFGGKYFLVRSVQDVKGIIDSERGSRSV